MYRKLLITIVVVWCNTVSVVSVFCHATDDGWQTSIHCNTLSPKTSRFVIFYIFAKYYQIFKILSQAHTVDN